MLALILSAALNQTAVGSDAGRDASATAAKPVQTAAEVAASRLALASMMRCVVNRSGYKVRKVLDLTVGGGGPQAPWAKLADAGCLDAVGKSLTFAPSLMRGSIYLALYTQDFGKTAPIAEFPVEPPVHYPVSEVASDGYGAIYRMAMSIADCAVRKDPLGARKVVLTEIATDDERAGIRAFVPALSGCIDAGNSLAMNSEVIKGIIAEALYRLTAIKRDNHHAQG